MSCVSLINSTLIPSIRTNIILGSLLFLVNSTEVVFPRFMFSPTLWHHLCVTFIALGTRSYTIPPNVSLALITISSAYS